MDEDDEAAPWKEQENWEADQIKKASMKVGSKDKAKQAQQYEFVFEDQIDFIKDMALAGDVVSTYHILTAFSVIAPHPTSLLGSPFHALVVQMDISMRRWLEV